MAGAEATVKQCESKIDYLERLAGGASCHCTRTHQGKCCDNLASSYRTGNRGIGVKIIPFQLVAHVEVPPRRSKKPR